MAQGFSIRVYPAVAAFLDQVAHLAGRELVNDPGYFYFHYPAWTQTIWDFWEEERQSRPFFLAAFQREELIGWWPLVLSKRTLGYRLQNLGQELSDYALPFIRTAWQEQRAALTAAFLQTSLAQVRNFAFAQFAGFLYPPDPFQPHSAGELQHWLRENLPSSWEIGPPVDNRTLKLSQTPADPEAFLTQHFSRKFQKNLKMDEKKLLKAGPLALKQLKGFAELAPLQKQYFAWCRYQDQDAGRRQRRLTAW